MKKQSAVKEPAPVPNSLGPERVDADNLAKNPGNILAILASEYQEQIARKQRAEKITPDLYQQLCAAVQAWRDAGWPDAVGDREPTAEERKAAKVPALLKIRAALDHLGAKVRRALLSAPAAGDPGRTYALALLFKVKPEHIEEVLPVPKRLEYDPIYTPLDEWISGKLLLEIRALLESGGSKKPRRVTSTSRFQTSASAQNIRLSPGEQNIINVIRQKSRRLTTQEILNELEKSGPVSIGTTKTCLAHLTRMRVLINRRDTDPPGYGLPHWS